LRNLILGSVLLFLTGGCSVALVDGYRQVPGNTGSQVSPVSWFSADTGHFLMAARIDVMKNYFTGLMVIKPLEGNSYRVVFITEVGLKIMDLEFNPGSAVKVLYMMDAMNRKSFLKILDRDFRLVLMTETGQDSPVVLLDQTSGDRILRYKQKGLRDYYYFQAGGNRPSWVRQMGSLGKKARAEFYGSEKTGIDSVKISHYHMKFRIGMFRVTGN